MSRNYELIPPPYRPRRHTTEHPSVPQSPRDPPALHPTPCTSAALIDSASDSTSAVVPGYRALFSIHQPDLPHSLAPRQPGQEDLVLEAAHLARVSALSQRPHASTFTRLADITIHDATAGYDPVDGFRRIQGRMPAQSTAPITPAEVRCLAMECHEAADDDLANNPFPGQRRIHQRERPVDTCRVFPKKLINGYHNPLHRGRRGSWFDTRVAVNAYPGERTALQQEQFEYYVRARDAESGVKMPFGMMPEMFDMFTEWEKAPGGIPASIRADPTNTLLAEDVFIHWIVRRICTGSDVGHATQRSKHLRLFLLALFKDGEHLWYLMPGNGIKDYSRDRPLHLADRARKAPRFEGSIRGEENLLRFLVYLQQSIRLSPWDIGVFGRWAARVMSGEVFNPGARTVRMKEPIPTVPRVVYENGTPSLDMPAVVKEKKPSSSAALPLPPADYRPQVFNPVAGVSSSELQTFKAYPGSHRMYSSGP